MKSSLDRELTRCKFYLIQNDAVQKLLEFIINSSSVRIG